jgi:hypothetical protein
MDNKYLNQIVLIVAYIGKLPHYINLFVETCKFNPSVDWIIFSDQLPPENKASNVKFIKMTLRDIEELIYNKLKLRPNITRGYKLCDFKPAYGIIFKDYLKEYDFWGHTDLDMVLGDIRKFITSNVLENYDIVSADERRLCGPFTLFRNCKKINELYQEHKDYEIIFGSNKHYAFDEKDFNEVVVQAQRKGSIHCLFRFFRKWGNRNKEALLWRNDKPEDNEYRETFLWRNGKLIVEEDNREIIFLHLRPWIKDFGRFESVSFPFKWHEAKNGWRFTKGHFYLL